MKSKRAFQKEKMTEIKTLCEYLISKDIKFTYLECQTEKQLPKNPSITQPHPLQKR